MGAQRSAVRARRAVTFWVSCVLPHLASQATAVAGCCQARRLPGCKQCISAQSAAGPPYWRWAILNMQAPTLAPLSLNRASGYASEHSEAPAGSSPGVASLIRRFDPDRSEPHTHNATRDKVLSSHHRRTHATFGDWAFSRDFLGSSFGLLRFSGSCCSLLYSDTRGG